MTSYHKKSKRVRSSSEDVVEERPVEERKKSHKMRSTIKVEKISSPAATASSKEMEENESPRCSEAPSTVSTAAESSSNLISKFRVSKQSLKCLKGKGIEAFFPIQEKTFDAIYDGKHVIGRARTGTGKTLALALPTIESLIKKGAFSNKRGERHRNCIVLVLLPTRELAQQVAAEFTALECDRYGTVTVVGGLPEDPQLRALKERGNVVVGTPGRTLDFLKRGLMSLQSVKTLILDEADQMLEMGFREDVDAILEHATKDENNTIKLDGDLQVLLFTATLPSWISSISKKYMSTGEKVVIDVVRGQQVQTALGVQHLSILCNWHHRAKILEGLIRMYGGGPNGRVIIFTETKASANEISMDSSISSLCQVLHGDIQQRQRETTLKAFKDGRFKCLVATDVAARGIHVEGVSLVIHLEPPKDVDTFVHRSGRTGRAGSAGVNIIFFRSTDSAFLYTIEKNAGIKFKRINVPQPKDMLKIAAQNMVEKIIAKSDETSDDLIEAANYLIAQAGKNRDIIFQNISGPTEAVARMISELTGFNEISDSLCISMITGRENFKTYEIIFNSKKINSKLYIGQALDNVFKSENISSKIVSLTLRADSTGAIFDLPLTCAETFDKIISKSNKQSDIFTVRPLTEYPEVNDPNFDANCSSSYDTKNPNSRSKRQHDNGGFKKRGGNFNHDKAGGFKRQKSNFGRGFKRS